MLSSTAIHPPPPCSYHTVVCVHEFFLFFSFFVLSLHALTLPRTVCLLSIYEPVFILLVSYFEFKSKVVPWLV